MYGTLCRSLGLSKSLGLTEGFGGRGKGGLPATLSPAEESDAKYLREKYGYNAYLSDKISLDRTIPDYRPSKSVHRFGSAAQQLFRFHFSQQPTPKYLLYNGEGEIVKIATLVGLHKVRVI